MLYGPKRKARLYGMVRRMMLNERQKDDVVLSEELWSV